MLKAALLIFALTLILVNQSLPARSDTVRRKLYGEIDEVNYACGAAGITVKKLPGKVEEVRQGSPAFYAGLEKNDQIVSGSFGQNKLSLVINRSGKTYALSIDTGPIDLSRERARTDTPAKVVDVTEPEVPVVDVNPKDDESNPLKRLAKFDITIVVDSSGSMNDELHSEPESKWKWCGDHIASFAEKMRPYLDGRGITLVTFANSYDLEHGCTPEHVENVFRTMTPRGATDMGSPLDRVLADYLATGRARPLLVVVLTDGMPNRGPKVEDVIIRATQDMHSSNEIKMTFLEIGEEYDGRALLKYLDDFLIYDGAKYDIVDTLTFDELKQVGLTGALVHALQDGPKTASTGQDLKSQLSQLKQQIEEARAAKPRARRTAKPAGTDPAEAAPAAVSPTQAAPAPTTPATAPPAATSAGATSPAPTPSAATSPGATPSVR